MTQVDSRGTSILRELDEEKPAEKTEEEKLLRYEEN